ncbi:MAG: glycosyltransferase [Gammaproteobacteria bacterium]
MIDRNYIFGGVEDETDQSLARSVGNVLFVIGSLDVGGAEHHLSQVAPELCRRGWRTTVYSLADRGAMAVLLEAQGVSVHAARSVPHGGSILRRLARLAERAYGIWRFIRMTRPDVVHFFLPAAYVVGGICTLATRQRCMVMSRRSLNRYQRRHRIATMLEHWLHKRMGAVLGNSLAVVRQLAAEGVPADRLRLIYNGIDLPNRANTAPRRQTRDALGVPADVFTMIVVANLIPYKGHQDLLKALAGIRPRMPQSWRLLCVGRDDGIQTDLQNAARSLGIVDNVLWLGPRRDVPDLLAASDMGILCSHEEGFSNALLEYMAAGLATVVTDVGGNREACVHGETGLIVPAGSPAVLGDAICHLANDDVTRAAMGRTARERVHTQFHLSRCVQAYEELYTSLLAGTKPLPVAWELGSA